MSVKPLGERNQNQDNIDKLKCTDDKTGVLVSSCTSSDKEKVTGVKDVTSGDKVKDDICCESHDGYCSDENCLEVTSSSRDTEPTMCRTCGRHGVRLKKCGKCKVVLYCSRDCQKKDYQKHKKTCQMPIRVEDDLKSLLHELTSSLTVAKPKTLTFSEAKVKAGKLFPGKDFLYELSKLNTFPFSGVFLGLIADMHPYFVRHGIYVKDRKGKQTTVFFYLDNDNPKPYFKWDDLRQNSYICICEPFSHTFSDGQVGMRIDEAADIRIIHP